MLRTLVNRLRGGASAHPLASTREVVAMRAITAAVLFGFVVKAFGTRPAPGLHGTGLAVLLATAGFVLTVGAGVIAASTLSLRRIPEPAMFTLVLAMSAATVAGACLQPDGSWEIGPYFVAVLAALRFGRVSGPVTLAVADGAMLVAAAIKGVLAPAASLLILSALPWFLILRLMRRLRDQNLALEASSVAEARAAATAERGRIARELHDVLAHSLSALALHLESTRMLARDRGAGGEIGLALDRAHHLAASGLDEARRAIAAARGEQVPGPDGLGALVDGFREQSALAIELEVAGEARELAPDARLAVYRTAQEALTNVRRHAVPERIRVRLEYRDDATVLVVEDRSGGPPPAAAPSGGFGLVGMRERAELLGGSLDAGPTGEGFRVELRLPSAVEDGG